jgi:hypothetical protein
MITVSVKTVDGGKQEWTEGDPFYRRFLSLRDSGLSGKALVDALLSDDWGAPPVSVLLAGKLEDGTQIEESIRYK